MLNKLFVFINIHLHNDCYYDFLVQDRVALTRGLGTRTGKHTTMWTVHEQKSLSVYKIKDE